MSDDHLNRDLADALNWIAGKLELPPSDVNEFSPDLPTTYLEFLELVGPGEGFIGHEYLRLFAPEQLPWVNNAYGVDTFLPGHLLFGSNGCGDAYLFKPTPGEIEVSRIPFIPLNTEYTIHTWDSFGHFLVALVDAPSEFAQSSYPETPNPEVVGKEVHEVHPVALGGNPTDPKNKVLVPVEKHAQLVSYWNKTFNAIIHRENDHAHD